MLTFITLLIFLVVAALAVDTVRAGENYNSSKSNTATSLAKGGVDERTIREILREIDKLREGVSPKNVNEILQRFKIRGAVSQKILKEWQELQAIEKKSRAPAR